ncbi:probable protein phosphatase 2C 42 isoform X3 [Populus trichocarpa]|uniref:probable protein phosphatase 2C 42 isoform X3 n=1 Tax=Populus trichocarpa TaxID=3694 RepID=UPI000D1885E4|nr:probable protein phosphatase 2C 42 isoform X3 [Populus trichocarpa]|eukprot:XP_024465462.1 probable protein phosphatase 2C 42 isoform X3 [Populus trichocarpa]
MDCFGIEILEDMGLVNFQWLLFKLIKYLKTKARLSLDLLELLSVFMMVMVDLKLHVLSVITCSGTFKKRIVPYVGNLRLCGYAPISAETQGVVTSETIQRAFCLTEEGFTNFVSELWSTRPQMATVGSCCLVGVICQQTLFVANLGDSRVVLGKKVGNTGGIAAIQLSTEHNANLEAIRHELEDLHPNDSQIAVLKRGVWKVKGIIQVSRSIGDVYMKHARFNREPIDAKFRLPEPMDMPILSANPTILSHPLHPNDSFLVFASDGLWEQLSNEKVVDIVHSNPRAGSAKRLVKAALQEAARKRETRYSDLQKIDKKVRRHFHDDITVIVLFLNHDLISKGAVQTPPVSIRSALEH